MKTNLEKFLQNNFISCCIGGH